MSVVVELPGRNSITYEWAKSVENKNIIKEAAYCEAGKQLDQTLWDRRQIIQALVRHHLGLSSRDNCVVSPRCQWIHGSFNVCVPVEVTSTSFSGKLMFRCAMPHKLAEAQHPGTVDEKLSSEVGTYVWCQRYCSEIRIPHLYGFGFSDGRHFTHEKHRPWYIRLMRILRQYVRKVFPSSILSDYIPNSTRQSIPTAYMLLEYIGPDIGQMLSSTWETHRKNPARRRILFRGIARLILSLARIPQPRIASLQFHDDCTVALTNRPMHCVVTILENNDAPRMISRGETYICTESFVADMLSFHDGSFLSNANAVYDDEDCRSQMAAKALLRTVRHHFINRERRNGPFVLQLTDFHASNIFVDKNWNVTCLIDLEWVVALPLETLAVPYWLTGRGIDEIEGKDLLQFNSVRNEFMEVLEKEESKLNTELKPALSRVMHENWESGATWFWHCLSSVDAMYSLVMYHICPKFSTKSIEDMQVLSEFWSSGSANVVENKVKDFKQYQIDLKKLFSAGK